MSGSIGESLAGSACAATAEALVTLVQALGPSTEPDFAAVAVPYQRMLGVALLLLAVVVAAALIENLLGGPAGAGWSVLPRTLVAALVGAAGLDLMAYASRSALLLSDAFALPLQGQARFLGLVAVAPAQPGGELPLGSVAGLLAVALLTLLLALLVYLELFLRAGLILVGTVFVPFVAAAWVWPRLAPLAGHLVRYLAALLLTKFVTATVLAVGYSLLMQGLAGTGSGSALAAAAAILAAAAFSPVLLLQGLRFAHPSPAVAARSWTGTVLASATARRLVHERAGALSGRRGPSRRSGRAPAGEGGSSGQRRL